MFYSVDNVINRQRRELSDKNKHILSVIGDTVNKHTLSVIGDTVNLCGMQEIHKGNFMAILEHAAKTDKILQEHLEFVKKNQKYTS